MNELIFFIKTKKDILTMLEKISFSNSYTLENNNNFIEYQSYSKINEQHIYNILEFLLNKNYTNKSIEITINSTQNIKFIIKF